MSELTMVLFKNLDLPVPRERGKLTVKYNALTRKVDGNTDSNNDGKIDKKDKNGWVEPEELYEEVFANRSKYERVLRELRAAGMEDPFEITPEIKAQVQKLFKRYKPRTVLEKSILLFRSVIPRDRSFKARGVFYSGLSPLEEGLEINYNPDFKAPPRIKLGDLLPKEILATPVGERIANCVEYTNLLGVLHHAAGIEAYPKRIATLKLRHVYLLVNLDNVRYRVDAGGSPEGILFTETKELPDADSKERVRMAAHYMNEAQMLLQQGKKTEAEKHVTLAMEFNATSAHAWGIMGILLGQRGKLNEALRCINMSIRYEPNAPQAWKAKAEIIRKLGKNKEAIRCEEKFRKITQEAN